MSRLSEYIKLLPAGIKNLPDIISGIRNNIKLEHGDLPQDEEDEIIRRRLICQECPFMSTNAIANGTYTTDRTEQHCTMCGCPITTKTANLGSNCGIETYNGKNLDNQLPLKWEKYKTT